MYLLLRIIPFLCSGVKRDSTDDIQISELSKRIFKIITERKNSLADSSKKQKCATSYCTIFSYTLKKLRLVLSNRSFWLIVILF